MGLLRKKQGQPHIGPNIVLSFDVFHDKLEMDVTEAEACTDGNSCSLASARLKTHHSSEVWLHFAILSHLFRDASSSTVRVAGRAGSSVGASSTRVSTEISFTG